MPDRVLALITRLSRRRPDLTRARQRAWTVRILASCLVHVAAARLSRAARRLVCRSRRRLSGIRGIWVAPNSLAVVVRLSRSPRLAFRIRCLTLVPDFFKPGIR